MPNQLPKLSDIPNPWKIFREDLSKVMEEESRVKLPKRWMRVARFILLAYRKFDEERCFMRAAALAFNSLLALIPVLALATALTTWIVDKDKPQQSSKTGSVPTIASTTDANATGPVPQFVSKIASQGAPSRGLRSIAARYSRSAEMPSPRRHS